MNNKGKILEHKNMIANPDNLIAELQIHIQNTNTQYNFPSFEKRIDRRSNRINISTHFVDPAVRTNIEVDVVLMDALHEQILNGRTANQLISS